MCRSRPSLFVAGALFGVFVFSVPVHAGLEFCSSQCSDGDPCTCDILNPDGTCGPHDPRQRWAAAARAWGISVELGGTTVIPPTPDSNKKNPDALIDVPADPLAHVTLLHVEEAEELRNGTSESYARAVATTGEVKVLDQGGGNWLLTVDSLKAFSESDATDPTATSTSEGSTLHHVVLNGVNLGDVTEPMEFNIEDPILHRRTDVRFLDKFRDGAAAGAVVPDPVTGLMVSGVTVDAIHVTVRDFTDPANPKTEADIIIGHADTRVDRFGPGVCTQQNPLVSGSGWVVHVDADEFAIDKNHELARTRIGEVVLPSRGGQDDADLYHLGPIVDPSGNLVLESKSAFAHTEGSTNDAAHSAQSRTVSGIEELRAFDQGSGPQLSADAVRAECTSTTDPASSTAKTTLLGLSIGGQDVCEQLQLGQACTPPPNTRITNSNDLDVIVNEQKADAPKSGCSGITVNAIHVHALGEGNSLGLPAGADVFISNAHCDTCTAP